MGWAQSNVGLSKKIKIKIGSKKKVAKSSIVLPSSKWYVYTLVFLAHSIGALYDAHGS